MPEQTPRELLAEADRQRSIAAGAESIRSTFRLGMSLAAKRGLFGIRPLSRRTDNEFRALSGSESMALYQAAEIVRREALARAEELEARVTTTATESEAR